jgi:uncharacterized protein
MNITAQDTPTDGRSFLLRFILLLLFVQAVSNALIFISAEIVFLHPRIPQFRLIGAACDGLTLGLFLLLWKPSLRELGLDGSDLSKRSRIAYAAGAGLVLLMVISSYFIMREIRLFALATNIQFGIVTPVLEETLFRGYGWSGFKRGNSGDLRTLVLTSVLFGLFHVGYYPQIAYATGFHPDAPSMLSIMTAKVILAGLLGLALGFIRWKSQKLYGPILLHSFLNIISP